MKRILLTFALVVSLAAGAFATPSGPNGGLVLLHNLPVWQDQMGGKLEWLEDLTLGDKVTLVGRTQNFNKDGKDKEYLRVRTPSGKEGWVRTPYIAVNATLGVIKAESALIYSEPRDLKVTANVMNFLTVIAILDNGSTNDFAKVAAVDPDSEVPFAANTYLTYPDLTIDENDVAAAIMYYVGKSTKNAAVKKNLLVLANKKYASSVFLPKLQTVLGGEAAVASVPFAGTYTINDNNVNVRSTPSTDGAVVSQLSNGTSVTTKERSAAQATAGTKTDYWYHISAPLDGWVFGSFITINP